MTRSMPLAAVPFPPIPSGRPYGFDFSRLRLRAFGTELEDLEVDFHGTLRPFLETEILRRCTIPSETALPLNDLLWDLEVGKRTECLLAIASLSDARPFIIQDQCGSPACGERMEIDLSVKEIAAAQRQAESNPIIEVEHVGAKWRLRRPTGRDMAAFREIQAVNSADSSIQIASALLTPDSDRAPLTPEGLVAIESALEDADPLVRLNLVVECPGCAVSQSISVDPGRSALDRLLRAQRSLLNQVHRLARAYHWNENEIFAVPAWRRVQYLAELDREEA